MRPGHLVRSFVPVVAQASSLLFFCETIADWKHALHKGYLNSDIF